MIPYAGIGARNTPTHILETMRETAKLLAKDGHVCNTGAALGADQAFANAAVGANGNVCLYLPWTSYESKWCGIVTDMPIGNVRVFILNAMHVKAYESVDQFHPAPGKLSQGVRKLHARNYLIIDNSNFVVCWTPEGKTVGGTGQGIKIANYLEIPVYNLGNPETLAAFEAKIEERRAEL